MAEILNWFILHRVELIGTLISFVYIYFSIKQNIWLWPFGLISSAIYVYVFLKSGIYADMGLQVYYVIISAYGWYYWKSNQDKNTKAVKIKSVIHARYVIIWLILVSSVLFVLLSQLLIYYTNSTIPYLDAFITALSITATWMLTKKYIEQWLIWIVVDTVSAGVYFYKELYLTIILYIVLAILAYVGYKAWIKDFRKETVVF
jgi:nicotinamide mononucleotide transporter